MQANLVSAHYPAAYDNLGWLYFTDKKNIFEAVKFFRAGVQLGDPDCMVSLAEMIDKGHTWPFNSDESKLALYGRAAALGHVGATQALQVEQNNETKKEADLDQQRQQQRIMLDMFGTIIQNIPRR